MPIPTVSKILCIAGPTGTGKTTLAIEVSKAINSELISADSRQVYKGMDVVTGKDHPEDVEIAGIDIMNPDEACSVAVWQEAILPALDYAAHFNTIPLIVGGTGLYIKSILHPIDTIGIPIDEKMRHDLSGLPVSELQKKLLRMDPAKYYSMNNSDVNNPRRLIRAIEVAQFGKDLLKPSYIDRPGLVNQLIIGLGYSDSSLYKSAVRQRVEERIKGGAIEETRTLLEKYEPKLPSLTAIGYRSLIAHINGQLTKEQLIDAWVADELNYAKRQMVWFKKMDGVEWYDVTRGDIKEKIVNRVVKWYANNTSSEGL